MPMLRFADTVQLTDTGRQRRDNEDSLFARAPVFVVADGMGGAQAGEVASRIAVETFEEGLPNTGSPEERLVARILEANSRIHELSRTQHERAGMGTTLTAALLEGSSLVIAHVGDSRAYLLREGSLARLTQDHSLVQALLDSGKLTEEQAEDHPQRSIITRALGPEPSVEVDTRSLAVRAGDVLLLCSDGLTSMVPDGRIAEILASEADLRRAGERLIAEANDAGGRDNITVILSRLEDAGDGAFEPPTPAEAGVAATAAPVDPGTRVQSAASTERSAGAGAALATQARPRTAPKRREPLMVRSGMVAPATDRQRSARRVPARWVKPMAALTATLIVLALVAAGGYLATRQLYFIGTDSDGVVTIFRGLPYTLPFGINLYETFYVSGVPAAVVPPSRRATLFNEDLRSQNDAETLVHDLELGQLSG